MVNDRTEDVTLKLVETGAPDECKLQGGGISVDSSAESHSTTTGSGS